MAKISVPSLDPELHQLASDIISKKGLDDDQKWVTSIHPLLLKRLETIEAQIQHSVTANANTPPTTTLDEVKRTLERIRETMEENFDSGPPFTIRRIAELLVQYEDSEYSLTTVALAHKYLLALARLICVQSKESSFKELEFVSASITLGSNSNANGEELPKDIKFERLLWDDAPITETILVTNKTELLEKVAERQNSMKENEELDEISSPKSEKEESSVEANLKDADSMDKTMVSDADKKDGIAVQDLVDPVEVEVEVEVEGPDSEDHVLKRAKLD